LFVVLAKNAEVLPLNDVATATLAQTLTDFSTIVNDIKREEGKETPNEEQLARRKHGSDALKYLRAVERAASDRLSRVRRDESLLAVLAPVLAKGDIRSFESQDAAWLSESVSADTPDDDDVDSLVERAHVRELLASDEPVS
jgi:hypothetical protein